jgi:hypothetical protein
MSEQNILNPNSVSTFNPDYGWSEGLPQMNSGFQAKSGKVYARQLLARGRTYDLAWTNRTKTDADALRQWEAQYRNDFFSYQDLERARYFSGRFTGPLSIKPIDNNKWNIQGQFVEIPGLPMYQYPAAWGFDSIFIEETDGFGNDLIKKTGIWTFDVQARHHNGAAYITTRNTGAGFAEWIYFGYGLRVWAAKASNYGEVDIYVDGTLKTTIDLYSAVTTIAQPIYTLANVNLGFHRVKLAVNAAHNGASSDFYIPADAIEVMQ